MTTENINQNEAGVQSSPNFPITLSLDLNRVNFILSALGELPSKSGAWELMHDIKQQGDTQIINTVANNPQLPTDAEADMAADI